LSQILGRILGIMMGQNLGIMVGRILRVGRI